MNKKNKILISVLAVLCAISTAFMIAALIKSENEKGEFVPPAFALDAATGSFEAPQEIEWSELFRENMEFRVGICSKLIIENNKADIYFSNNKENKVWLKLRILNSKNDNIVYESGLIKPGQYIKSAEFLETLHEFDNVKLKIMAYQPDTYYSEGSIVLNTTVRSGG